jgi:hypothetical protein
MCHHTATRAERREAPAQGLACAAVPLLASLCLAHAGLVHADTQGPGAGKPTATGGAAAAQKTSPVWQTMSGKHMGSGVVMRYAVPAKIAVGETVTVQLQFLGISAADGATVEVRDRATRATVLTLNLSAGEQRTVELPYANRTDGMQFLDVTTTQGGRLTVQSIPLRVGSGELKLKPQGQRATTADGEAVISLPAASPGASR